MQPLYFHKLTKKDKATLLLNFKISQIVEAYEQPTWCGKHEALNGLFGCEKLLGLTNEIITKESCKICKYCKNEN